MKKPRGGGREDMLQFHHIVSRSVAPIQKRFALHLYLYLMPTCIYMHGQLFV